MAMLVALTVAAILVHLVGARVVGSVVAWQRWLHGHAWMFGLWRLVLYAAIARGWWWMRTRVRRRDASPEARRRLLHAEALALLAVALTEGFAWLHSL